MEEHQQPPPPTTTLSSRLTQLMDSHQKQWRRVGEMEKQLDEFAIRQRRRVANLLDHTPTHRRSHLRLFVTHQFETTNIHNNLQHTTETLWTLVLEGKLLIGHLDHQSATQVEQTALLKAKASGTATVLVPPPSTDPAIPPTPLARSTDRSQYRSVGEREEDPVEAIHFTHLFDSVKVEFQTVFQPYAPDVGGLPKKTTTTTTTTATPNKKSRTKRKAASDMEDARPAVDPALLSLSPTTTLQWTKATSQTDDTHAFFIHYKQPHPPSPQVMLHSVVATITLTPSVPEDTYKPSLALATAFFPKHLPVDYANAGGHGAAKRRKGNEGGGDAYFDVIPTEKPVPLEYQTIVPGTLSWNEIVTALSQYISEKDLQDEADKSIIHNDSLLQSLFNCETMSFSDVKKLLLSRELVSVANLDPILITYIMTEQTASAKQHLESAGAAAAASAGVVEETNPSAQLISFDIDVYVPSLFPYRARELLRRIKKREFEYTSSRTKARYTLMGSNKYLEEVVKLKIEQAVCGKGFTSEHIPVFLALARAAPPLSEARTAAQIDAKTCVLLERVQQHSRAAQAAWDLVDMCRGHDEYSKMEDEVLE